MIYANFDLVLCTSAMELSTFSKMIVELIIEYLEIFNPLTPIPWLHLSGDFK